MPSELASVLTVLGAMWAERPTHHSTAVPSAPLRIRVTRDSGATVVSLAGHRATRRAREVARAS